MTDVWLGMTAMALAASAPVTTKPCLTDVEIQSLVIFALPDAVMSVQTRCRPTLPQTSLLMHAGPIVAARWRHDAALIKLDAERAIDKISRLPISTIMGPDGARQAIQPIVSREIGKWLTSGDCQHSSELIDALSPLPARNVARVVIALGERQMQSRALPFTLCKKAS